MNIAIKVILICFICINMWVNIVVLALKSGPQIAAKTGNPAGLLFRRIWYSVGKSGVIGITEYRQGRPLHRFQISWIDCKQGSYKKLNLKFKNIQEHFWGKTNLFKNISGASSAHFIYNTINRAISFRETKSLTEVGAVKNVNNHGYNRKNRHSVLLRGMLFNQEMNVQR